MNEIDEDDFPEVDFRPNDFVEEDRAQVVPEGNVVPIPQVTEYLD